ncbi:MAG: phage tail sheath C-terminal domain-containing protein [Bacillota bacterium]|jgi:hypothetical protein
MAGGIFTVENKIRPGAYINFTSVRSPYTTAADRGVATMPLVMDWGAEGEVIEVLSSDLLDGKSLTKIGYTAADKGSLLFRECLKNCYKLLAYRLNDGVKAEATLGNLEVTAACSGVRGNDLKVSVVKNGDDFLVNTYLDNKLEDSQQVTGISQLCANDWVKFSGEGELAAAVPTGLCGGDNGQITEGAYDAYFAKMLPFAWQVMGIPATGDALGLQLKNYIKNLRAEQGKKVQGVICDYAADYEGIISSKQGYRTAQETVSAVDFVAWVTGVTAGATINKSNTYKIVEDAEALIGEMSNEEIKGALAAGYFVLSKRSDGKIVVEQDINTLVNYQPGLTDQSFAKNRVIRTLDEVANQVALIFEKYYLGKVDNSAAGRELFSTDIINYCRSLAALGAIENLDIKEDIQVAEGGSKDSVLVTLGIWPLDSMEKLYMTVEVG